MLRRIALTMILATLPASLAWAQAAPAAQTILKADGLRQLTYDARGANPAYSPGGKSIAYIRAAMGNEHGAVCVINPDGKAVVVANPEKLEDGSTLEPDPAFGVRWSPDGGQLLYKLREADPGIDFASGRPITDGPGYVISLRGAGKRKISENPIVWAEWSPSGRQVALLERNAGATTLVITDSAAWKRREIPKLSGRLLAWSPDESRIALGGDYGRSTAIVELASGDSSELKELAGADLTGLGWAKGSLVAGVMRGSAKIASPVGGCDLVLRDATGALKPLTANGASTLPVVSPDQRHVAFIRGTPLQSDSREAQGVTSSLWIEEIATGRQELVSPYTDAYSRPAWTPKGDGLLFTSQGNLWAAELRAVPKDSMEALPAREQARMAVMMSNLKQVGMGLMMYMNDNKDLFPPDAEGLVSVLKPYLRDDNVFGDPDNPGETIIRYFPPGVKANEIAHPSEYVLAEIALSSGFVLQLYADAHVATIQR